MMNLNPDTVCFLISKARIFHCKEDVVIPDPPDSSSEDWALQVMADHAGDSVFEEFKATIDDLEPDQQQALVALMWIGREEFSASEWDMALAEARIEWNQNTAEYLIAHPQLADYLREGLDALGYSCES
jgi:hypothetical protein